MLLQNPLNILAEKINRKPLNRNKKSRIRETLNLSTCAVSSTDTIQKYIQTIFMCHMSRVPCHLSPVTCHLRKQQQPQTLPLCTVGWFTKTQKPRGKPVSRLETAPGQHSCCLRQLPVWGPERNSMPGPLSQPQDYARTPPTTTQDYAGQQPLTFGYGKIVK